VNEETDIVHLHQRSGLFYNENVIAPGAQTESPGDAGPVRTLLGRIASPAEFLFTLCHGPSAPFPFGSSMM
jgi:hypothetical protein